MNFEEFLKEDDISYLYEGLNDAQREAVCAPPDNRLVLAGAGSGKTRVLIHRIGWLMKVEQIRPHSILAVTFTNKAAAEMKSRLHNLLGMPTKGLWVGTFHGLAHRFLRMHYQEAGLPENFQVLDSDDQLRLIKRSMKALELDDKRWPPKQAQWFINHCKDEALRPQHLQPQNDLFQQTMQRVYTLYQTTCEQSGLVDFAELLLRVFELLQKDQALLAHYQQRFRHLLVDEFQDTNTLQYRWLKLLAGNNNRIFAVGDDDQSIYGWRGAKVGNIKQLSTDYPGLEIVRLEQNYRSTGNILAAANALIDKNSDRLGKNLWTEGAEGEPVRLFTAFNDLDEARFAVDKIQSWVDGGKTYSDCALLYRSNAQSRVLEDQLIQAQIPYRVYGGLRFFDRAEIKDALGYLRLVANPKDDAAFERVVNMPTRGIGDRTLEGLREVARQQGISLWEASEKAIYNRSLSGRAGNSIRRFMELIIRLQQSSADLLLHELVEHMLEESTLLAHYKSKKGDKEQNRVENLEELVNAARQFAGGGLERIESPEDSSLLSAFLSLAALESGEEQSDAPQDCVQLMTLHSAKGLEFPLVFLCGLEEGLFPNAMAVQEGNLEEERRLCYVGMTRAMEQLYITHAESRMLHGSKNFCRPSRFIMEIPAELLEEVRLRNSGRPQYEPSRPSMDFRAASSGGSVANGGQTYHIGQSVKHPKFGAGIILGSEGQGDTARVLVNFEDAGEKWLLLSYAKLEAL